MSSYYAKNTHEYMQRNELLIKFIGSCIEPYLPNDVDEVIELGPGMGRFSDIFLKKYKKTHLVEPSSDYAAELKLLIDKSKLNGIVHNQTAKDFFTNHDKKESKDLVACFHVMHHLTLDQRNDVYDYVAEHNSYGFFCEPNPYNPLFPIQILFNSDMSFEEEKQYLKLTKARYVKELNKYNLKIISYGKVCFLPPFVIKRLLHMFSVNTLLSIDRIFCRIPIIPSYIVATYGK